MSWLGPAFACAVGLLAAAAALGANLSAARYRRQRDDWRMLAEQLHAELYRRRDAELRQVFAAHAAHAAHERARAWRVN